MLLFVVIAQKLLSKIVLFDKNVNEPVKILDNFSLA